jgi:hypothetical protein
MDERHSQPHRGDRMSLFNIAPFIGPVLFFAGLFAFGVLLVKRMTE